MKPKPAQEKKVAQTFLPVPGGRSSEGTGRNACATLPVASIAPITPITPVALITFIIRVAVAAMFLSAGYSKAGDPADFALAIERYRIVPREIAVITALFLPCLEIVCAIALFSKKLRAGAAALLTACNIVFSIMLVIALARGLDISCGCFGGADAATGPVALALSLARALALAAACAWLLARAQRK